MALKDILVHIDNSKSNAGRLDAAVQLACDHDAHLTGLYIIPHYSIPTYAEVQIPADILKMQEKEAEEVAEKAHGSFLKAVDKAGCAAEWRCVKGYTDRLINAHARYTDIVVLGQAEESGLMSEHAEVDDHVVLAAARPVLFIPYIGVKGAIGKRIMVAWNGSRESVRVVNDALPLLQKADNVDVVVVNPSSHEGDIPTADICLHLARHGVKAQGGTAVAKDIDVGDVLLSRAADEGIDLIVMGAYGHSRLRETILGGVTRHLLEHMTVPVLMSH